MKKSSSIFAILGYIYVVLPILIFFIGWCNPITAIIGTGIILASLYLAIKNAPQLWLPENKKQILFLGSLFVIALIWVYLSGIGAFVYQNSDHNCRNPIFELLVTEPWPVNHEQAPAILTYYIGFWLPSAVVGKIFNSIQVGYCCQVLWATIGIFLFFYYVLAGLKKKNYIPIIIFIFFSGLDIVGEFLANNTAAISNITYHIEWWSHNFQLSSMTTQLFWVFNQAIAAWLLVPLLSLEKNNKSIGFLYSCLFLHSTLPAIGMFPFILYWCFKNGQKKLTLKGLKPAFLSIFTFQNLIGSMCVFIICYLYLSNNYSGGVFRLYLFKHWLIFIVWLVTVFLLEVGIYLIAIFKIYKKSLLYYITTCCFLIYPFIMIGLGSDFCMRATIPALVVLYMMICKSLEMRYFYKKHKYYTGLLIFAILIGAVTPLHEFARTIVNTQKGIIKQESNLGFLNFYGPKENNKFLKYFGKIN